MPGPCLTDSWGEAFLTLHRVHACANERPRFGVAAAGESGWRLAGRLPGLPVIVAGDDPGRGDRVVLRVTRRRDVYRQLKEALEMAPDPRADLCPPRPS
jgi:hypothetical protein